MNRFFHDEGQFKFASYFRDNRLFEFYKLYYFEESTSELALTLWIKSNNRHLKTIVLNTDF